MVALVCGTGLCGSILFRAVMRGGRSVMVSAVHAFTSRFAFGIGICFGYSRVGGCVRWFVPGMMGAVLLGWVQVVVVLLGDFRSLVCIVWAGVWWI